MRRIVALFMFVVVALFVAGFGISSQVQAKGEPPIPGTTIKEIPPFIEGTLILLPDTAASTDPSGGVSFIGDCVKPFDTRFFNSKLAISLDQAVVSGDPIVGNNIEGSTFIITVPTGCFKDNATSVNVIIKSVRNFAPVPATGPGRTSIVARVLVSRFIYQ